MISKTLSLIAAGALLAATSVGAFAQSSSSGAGGASGAGGTSATGRRPVLWAALWVAHQAAGRCPARAELREPAAQAAAPGQRRLMRPHPAAPAAQGAAPPASTANSG